MPAQRAAAATRRTSSHGTTTVRCVLCVSLPCLIHVLSRHRNRYLLLASPFCARNDTATTHFMHSRDHHLHAAEHRVDRGAQRPGGAPQRAAAGGLLLTPCCTLAKFRGILVLCSRHTLQLRIFLGSSVTAFQRVLPMNKLAPYRKPQVHWLRVILDEGHTLGPPALPHYSPHI